MTSRAAETLCRADYILAEDKRVSAKLLAHVGAKAPMTAYHDHSDDKLRERILNDLGTKAVALISDAGTPLISDPGYKLVRAARHAGHAVHTLPGPCAAIAALTLAGLPTDRFLFLGFLPAKAKARAEVIAEVAAVRASLVIYESGPRLGESLAALGEGLGSREGAVIREISKLHEETVTGSLAELAESYAKAAPKGEIVIVVGPPPEREAATDEELDEALRVALASMSASRAAADVANSLGIPKKRAYARALELAGSN
jgi:16S rRNA (cytidine1402-2'-O)-methyltransferase